MKKKQEQLGLASIDDVKPTCGMPWFVDLLLGIGGQRYISLLLAKFLYSQTSRLFNSWYIIRPGS